MTGLEQQQNAQVTDDPRSQGHLVLLVSLELGIGGDRRLLIIDIIHL